MKTAHKKKAHSLKKAAESLFHRYGYNRTTLTLIAEEAGVSANELNRIYSTKRELFLNLYMDEKKVIRNKLSRIIGEGNYTHKQDAANTLLKVFWQIEKNKFLKMIYVFGDFPVQYCLQHADVLGVDPLYGHSSLLEQFLVQFQKAKSTRTGNPAHLADAFRSFFHLVMQRKGKEKHLKKEDTLMVEIFMNGLIEYKNKQRNG